MERGRDREGGGGDRQTERHTDRQIQRETERNKEREGEREMWVGERERFHHRVSKLGVGEGAEEEYHVSKE